MPIQEAGWLDTLNLSQHLWSIVMSDNWKIPFILTTQIYTKILSKGEKTDKIHLQWIFMCGYTVAKKW